MSGNCFWYLEMHISANFELLPWFWTSVMEVKKSPPNIWGCDSSVGIATHYGLDGPGIESRWGARFSAPVYTDAEAHPAYCTLGTRSFPGVKRPGRDADHPPPFKRRSHERVGLYLYFLWASVTCYRRTFTLPPNVLRIVWHVFPTDRRMYKME
jgi:hypothetical protein